MRLDRELRRTVTQATRGRIPILEMLSAMTEWRLLRVLDERDERDLPSGGRGPRPVVPTAGGLRLVAAEQGSCLLLLEALGTLQALLTSQPITAVVNAVAMTGALSSVRARFGRKDALAGLTAR